MATPEEDWRRLQSRCGEEYADEAYHRCKEGLDAKSNCSELLESLSLGTELTSAGGLGATVS